jgi:hypothetical protein
MEYSTLEAWQGISASGIVYTLGSLYDRFQWISDPRKAKGKQYSLLTLLVLIFLAKLSGKDTPVEMADWAKNHAEELAQLLGLKAGCHTTTPFDGCSSKSSARKSLNV